MTRILDRIVRPSDCTIAIALPLTKEKFFSDLDVDTPNDYAKCFRSQIWEKLTPEALWARYKENIVNLVDDVTREVERLGVKVVRDIRLADFSSILDREVITIVSHWRGAIIEQDDFIDFMRFIERLNTSSDEVITNIRRKLPKHVVEKMQGRGNSASFKKEVVKELNQLLKAENLGNRIGFESAPNEQPLPVEQRTYFNRVTLERAFNSELKKGNQVEFYDRLQSPEAIRNQIPDSFDGLLNLIICNSILPAESIKSMKRNCLIISNQYPAKPRFRLLEYKAIIKALHIQPNSFVNTMMNVRQMLGNYLQNI